MEQLDLFDYTPGISGDTPHEWKLVSIRECPFPEELSLCQTPERAVAYWRLHIEQEKAYDRERECFVVLILNAKMRVRGHHVVSIGTLNECLVHPREVFRVAILAAAFAILVMHNHPSGEPEPSEADRRMTRRLRDVAELHGIALTDHVIVGSGRYFSFKENGLV